MTETLQPQVHDYLEYTMVTDTQVYRVTRVSESSIWVVPCVDKQENGNHWNDFRGGPYPCTYTEVEPAMEEEPRRLGRRKDGTYRIADYCRPLRKATMILGSPVRYTDYRM